MQDRLAEQGFPWGLVLGVAPSYSLNHAAALGLSLFCIDGHPVAINHTLSPSPFPNLLRSLL